MKNQPLSTGMNRRDFVKSTTLAVASAFLPRMAFASNATFPEGFLWGVASASAQVESRKGRGKSNWDLFADQKGHIVDGSTNVVNTEFESRYAEDLKLLSGAGVNAFRFSFAWPRIQPDGPGKPSAEGLEVYDRIIDEMLRVGIQPAATMIHWDFPLWAGDLRQRDITGRMADYAEILTRKFGDRVRVWLALNEPNSVAAAGYGLGIHAPGLTSREAVGAAIHHQNLAQGLMIAAARANLPAEAKVGTTINVTPTAPIGDLPENLEAAKLADDYWNKAWLDPLFGREYPESIRPFVEQYVQSGDSSIIAAKPDHLGVNYYCRLYVKAGQESPIGFLPDMAYVPPNRPHLQTYTVEPDGLTEILTRIHKEYDAPQLYITETGFAVDDPQPVNGVVIDPKRAEYLGAYLNAAQEAIRQGVNLKGLFYWSATDNWEWAEGFSKTFGLIQIDRSTQARTPKQSLEYYAACIKQNGVAPVAGR